MWLKRLPKKVAERQLSIIANGMPLQVDFPEPQKFETGMVARRSRIGRTDGVGVSSARRAAMYGIICHMKRTTIFVPESLERDLQLYARREHRAVASLVRDALADYLAARRPAAALPSFTGIGHSGQSDIASRHEERLWRDPPEAAPPPSRVAGQRRPSVRKRR